MTWADLSLARICPELIEDFREKTEFLASSIAAKSNNEKWTESNLALK